MLVRFGSLRMVLYGRDGERFDWLAALRRIPKADAIGEWPVWIAEEAGQARLEGRLCALRKSEEAIQRSQRKLRRRAQWKPYKTRRATLAGAAYVVVFTTLPAAEATSAQVLNCYRLRWQIELVFKRLRSLVALGHIPKYDARSSRAWLYAKLLAALLSQKLTRLGTTFSPWGYPLGARAHPQSVA